MAEDLISTNLKLRELLKRSSPLMLKRTGTQTTTSLGGTIRQKLINVGLLTGLWVKVKADVSLATGTAAVYKLGPKGFWALLPRVRMQDFDGSDRVSATGWQLRVLNAVRGVEAYSRVMAVDVSSTVKPAGALNHPDVPTSTGAQTITGWIYVPIAFNPRNDLRGMILAQTGVGELYAHFDIASALFGTDDTVVYQANGGSGHSVTLTSLDITTYQEFYLPQNVEGVVPIPPLDTLTVYELNGAWTTSDNIAVNSEKLISIPNARSLHGIYYDYVDNGNFTDISEHRVIANGNSVIREYLSVDVKEIEQRWKLGYDLPDGNYFIDSADVPIQTNLFGNIQLGVKPSAVTSNSKVEVMFESMYLKGSALSGVNRS